MELVFSFSTKLKIFLFKKEIILLYAYCCLLCLKLCKIYILTFISCILAIIFPTIWNYIHKRLKGESDMLGIIIASYSLSSFFANPLIGWWSDKSLNTRIILLVTILAEMIGSLLYFVGTHTWVLIIGRLIAGNFY